MSARDALAVVIEDFITRNLVEELHLPPGPEACALADRILAAGYIHRDHAPMLAIDKYLEETK